jgi:hypothetical protein
MRLHPVLNYTRPLSSKLMGDSQLALLQQIP